MRRFTLRSMDLICAGLLWLPASVSAGAPPEAAKSCSDCHGDQGVSKREEVPTIAGMSAFYLDNQLHMYQKAARPCEKLKRKDTDADKTDMCEIAKKLNDADIKQVAEYFASLPFVPSKQAFDAQRAALGAKVHKERCEKCHSEGGSLADDDAGILAGQTAHYLKETFEEYRAKKRWQEEKMTPQIDALKPEEVDALVQFYAGEGAK